MAVWTASRQKNGSLALSKQSPANGVEDLGSMPAHPRDTEALMTWLFNQEFIGYGDVIVMPERTYLMHAFDARA